jgi:hypothetical protein
MNEERRGRSEEDGNRRGKNRRGRTEEKRRLGKMGGLNWKGRGRKEYK